MPDFEFLHDYTAQDHNEVMQSALRRSRHREKYLWLIFLAALGFFAIWRLDGSEMLIGLYLGAIAGWLLTLYSSWKQYKQQWSATYLENPSFRGQLRSTLTADGLRRHGTDTEFFCTWKATTSLEESANLFILYLGKNWFITIPKRVCETPTRLEELRAFLSTRIPQKV